MFQIFALPLRDKIDSNTMFSNFSDKTNCYITWNTNYYFFSNLLNK